MTCCYMCMILMTLVFMCAGVGHLSENEIKTPTAFRVAAFLLVFLLLAHFVELCGWAYFHLAIKVVE